MQSPARYILLFLTCIGFACGLMAQTSKFDMGFSSAVILSQIEGDNLRGFNKFGYSFGLIGGYSINSGHKFVVSYNFENFGSTRSGESVPIFQGRALAEMNLNKISMYLGYSKLVGEDWDGNANYRFSGGFKINQIIKSSARINKILNGESRDFGNDNLRKRYPSLKIGIGRKLSNNIFIDIAYEHALTDILEKSETEFIGKLIPFYLAFELSYSVF